MVTRHLTVPSRSVHHFSFDHIPSKECLFKYFPCDAFGSADPRRATWAETTMKERKRYAGEIL